VGCEDEYRRWARWFVRGANLLYAASLLADLASLAEARAGRTEGWVVALCGVAVSLWLTGVGVDALASIARAFAEVLAAPASPDEEG